MFVLSIILFFTILINNVDHRVQVNTIGRTLTGSSICIWWLECWKCFGVCNFYQIVESYGIVIFFLLLSNLNFHTNICQASFRASHHPKSWLGISVLFIRSLGGCLVSRNGKYPVSILYCKSGNLIMTCVMQ